MRGVLFALCGVVIRIVHFATPIVGFLVVFWYSGIIDMHIIVTKKTFRIIKNTLMKHRLYQADRITS